MDEQQVKDYLGVRPGETRPLLAEIVEGMRDVPWPEDEAAQNNAFWAFLRCWPRERREGIYATEVQQWLDHKGGEFTARAADPPTAYRFDDGHTHQLLRPPPGRVIQAITLCGKRGLEVPGRGDVDCPRCLDTR